MSNSLLLITTLFVAYFAIHSLTASLRFKQAVIARYPLLARYYRLLFNALATLLFLPIALLVLLQPGELLWEWQGGWFYFANGLALLAGIAFLFSLRMYDMQEFSGLRQLREGVNNVEDQERFKITPFHRFVRHPWYTMLLVLIWTRDITTTQLLVYLLITLYLIIGSRMEERKLITYHGEVYRRYRQRVPGLIPLPWRFLRADEVAKLLGDHE